LDDPKTATAGEKEDRLTAIAAAKTGGSDIAECKA
jgi:hypothetical protein